MFRGGRYANSGRTAPVLVWVHRLLACNVDFRTVVLLIFYRDNDVRNIPIVGTPTAKQNPMDTPRQNKTEKERGNAVPEPLIAILEISFKEKEDGRKGQEVGNSLLHDRYDRIVHEPDSKLCHSIPMQPRCMNPKNWWHSHLHPFPAQLLVTVQAPSSQ